MTTDVTVELQAYERERIGRAAHKAMIAVGQNIARLGLHFSVDDNSLPVGIPAIERGDGKSIYLRFAIIIGRPASRFDFNLDVPSVAVCELIDSRSGAHEQVGLLASPGSVLSAKHQTPQTNNWYGSDDVLPSDDDVSAFVEQHALRLAKTLLAISQPPGK